MPETAIGHIYHYFFKQIIAGNIHALQRQIGKRRDQRRAFVCVVENMSSSQCNGIHCCNFKNVIQPFIVNPAVDPRKRPLKRASAVIAMQPWLFTEN
ncbi:hypothetical protein JAB4_059680 (plasmid) [Janthinobacterium sp. HH102]|nr:hypothetical protein JAB4_059680 [Janthinobacterium sp. HH102]